MIFINKRMNIGNWNKDLPKTEMKAMIGRHLYMVIGCSDDIWTAILKVKKYPFITKIM